MSDVDKIVDDLTALPLALFKQSQRQTKIITTIVQQQEQIINLICRLHDIDIDEVRKELQSFDTTTRGKE